MSKSKNEEGYVLVIVILFVVLIMGFSSVFMTNAITHTKQEEVVDQQHLTVNIAEMGVEYYSTVLKNEYKLKMNELETKVAEELEKIVQLAQHDNEFVIDMNFSNDKIKNIVANELRASLSTKTEELNEINEVSDKFVFFIFDNPDSGKEFTFEYLPAESVLKVSGQVMAKNKQLDKEIVLGYQHDFLIPDFTEAIEVIKIVLEEGSEIDDEESSDPKSWIDINIDMDKELNEINLSDIIPKGDCDKIKEGNYHDQKNCIVNNLTIDKNHLQLSKSSFWIHNNMLLNDSLTLGNSSILEVNGEYIGTQLNMNAPSKMKVSNDFNLSNGIQMNQNTRLIIGGNSKSVKSVQVNGNSKLTVGENFNITDGGLTLNNSELLVGKDFDLSNNLNLNSASKLTIGGKLNMPKGTLELTGESELLLGRDLELSKGNLRLNNYTEFTAGGKVNIPNGNLELNTSAQMLVGSDLILKDNLMLHNDSKVTVGESVNILEGKLEMNTNAQMLVRKNLNLKDNLVLNNSSEVLVGKSVKVLQGDLTMNTSAKLMVNNDLDISNSKIKMHNNSLICVGGDLFANKKVTYSEPAKIYVKGRVVGNTSSDNIITGSDSFPSECVINIPSDEDEQEEPDIENINWREKIKWEDSIVDVIY